MMPAEQVCWGAEAMEIESHVQDPQCGNVAAQNDFNGTADMETDSSHTIEGRARDYQALGEAAASSNGQSGHAATDAGPGAETPAEQVEQPAAPPSEQQLAERAAMMFVVGARAPVASGMPAAAQEATKELVLRAWSVISALCKANGKELSSSFGNFDKLVGLGWLLGDVVIGYLIAGEDALAVHTAPPSLRRTTLLNERVRHERRDSSHDSEVRFAAPSAPLRACACIARPWRTARCPSRGRAPFMVIQRPWQLVSAGAWEGPRIFQGVTGSGAYLVSAH